MMTKNNHSTGVGECIMAVLLLALVFAIAQPAMAQSQWVNNGNNINNTNSGNVGVATTTPLSTLHIASMATDRSRGMTIEQSGANANSAALWLQKNRGTFASPVAVMNGDAIATINTEAFDGSTFWSAARIRFSVDGPVSNGSVPTSIQFLTNGVERFRLSGAGNLGIGTITPAFLLDLVGTTNALFRVRDTSNREYFSTTTRTGPWGTSPVVNLGGSRLIVDADTAEGGNSTILRRFVNHLIINPSDHPTLPGAFIIRQQGGDTILFADQNPNGRIGIGTLGPAFKLDVQGGQINASGGLCIAGDCRSSWSQVGGGGSQWVTSGNNISYSAGNVGIGTTTPASKLQVIGDLTVSGTGNISASGTISAGNVIAKYQDIAEWVSARNPMPAGTVVVLDLERSNQVVASQQAYDTRVAGVVSERPGVILGQAAQGKVMVATTGRVRVKVDATRAPIRVGDLLVTSDNEGIAMRSEPLDLGQAKIHRPGTIIGKALEPLANGVGEILVLLSLQ